MKRLKELETEHARLWRAISDLTLDKLNQGYLFSAAVDEESFKANLART